MESVLTFNLWHHGPQAEPTTERGSGVAGWIPRGGHRSRSISSPATTPMPSREYLGTSSSPTSGTMDLMFATLRLHGVADQTGDQPAQGDVLLLSRAPQMVQEVIRQGDPNL